MGVDANFEGLPVKWERALVDFVTQSAVLGFPREVEPIGCRMCMWVSLLLSLYKYREIEREEKRLITGRLT